MKKSILLASLSFALPLLSCGNAESKIDYSGFGTKDNPFTVDMLEQFAKDEGGDSWYQLDTIIQNGDYYVQGIIKDSSGVFSYRSLLKLEGKADIICSISSWGEEIRETYSKNSSKLFNGDPGTMNGYLATIKLTGVPMLSSDSLSSYSGELVSFGRAPSKKEYARSPKRLTYTLFHGSDPLPCQANYDCSKNISDLRSQLREKENEENNTYRFLDFLYENEKSTLRFDTSAYHTYVFTKVIFTLNGFADSNPVDLSLTCKAQIGWQYDYDEIEKRLAWENGQASIEFAAEDRIAYLEYVCGEGRTNHGIYSVSFEYTILE